MPAGLGGAGYVAIVLETVMGTYLPPSTAGVVFVPIISESLHYVEDKYYSPAIRQQTIVNDVKPGYYHVEGDIVMEADANYLPYFLHCSRHSITKTGAADPWQYDYVPSQAGSASTAASGNVARTMSIGVIRNGIGFGYGGCVVNTMEWTIDGGILRVTFGILGLSEQQPGGLGTPSWIVPELFGADSHNISVDVSGTAPAFAAADLTFNGFTFNTNYNAAAQNRIVATRAAQYISYGETEATYTTELDFLTRAEFDNFKASTTRAIQLLSTRAAGSTFAASTEAVRITVYRSTYDAYDLGLGGMGDLIMASVTGRVLSQTGGNPYQITIKGNVNIT